MSARTHVDDAARWFLRLQDSGTDARVFLEWQRWMNDSAAHRAAYAEIEETYLQLNIPHRPPLPSDQELAADDYDGSVPVEEWHGATANPAIGSPAPVRTMRYALAAGVAAMAVAAGMFWQWNAHHAQYETYAYSTPAGERQEFVLPEGSRITLDAGSVLNVELTSERRTLVLTQGEGYFKVSKDAKRPFTVLAGNTLVRAVGTAFNVRRSANRTVVAVTEGKVEVTSSPPEPPPAAGSLRDSAASHDARERRLTIQLKAGEAVSDMGEGHFGALTQAEAALATSWLDGRRQYRKEPLRYVLADIGRYSGRRIEIADDSTGELQFTGTLMLDSSDSWLKALAIALPVTIVETPNGALSVARDPDR